MAILPLDPLTASILEAAPLNHTTSLCAPALNAMTSSTLAPGTAFSGQLNFAHARSQITRLLVVSRSLKQRFFDQPAIGFGLAGLGVTLAVASTIGLRAGLELGHGVLPHFVHSPEKGLDMIGLGVKVVMLEGLTLTIAELGILPFPQSIVSKKRVPRYLAAALSSLLTLPAVGVALVFSIGWSLFVEMSNAGLDVAFFMMGALPITSLVFPLLRPSLTPVLKNYPFKRMALTTAATIGLAFIFAAPSVFIHDWFHWFVYNSTYVPPIDVLRWSLTEGSFTPDPHAAFSPIGIFRHLTETQASAFYRVSGDAMKWAYGFGLLTVSLFMKRIPLLKRALQLGGISVGFFSLHYMLENAAFPKGVNLDWQSLSNAGWALLNSTFLPLAFGTLCLLLALRIMGEQRSWLAMTPAKTVSSVSPLQKARASRTRARPWFKLALVIAGTAILGVVIILVGFDIEHLSFVVNVLCTVGIFSGITGIGGLEQIKKLQHLEDAVLSPGNSLEDYRNLLRGLLDFVDNSRDLERASWAAELLSNVRTRLNPNSAFFALANLGINYLHEKHLQFAGIAPIKSTVLGHSA